MGKNEILETRDGFNSKLGFVLACIGSAVGMGNIWLFPYRMATYGGSFLLVYLVFDILIGLSGVIGEMSFGRAARSGPIGAFGTAMASRGEKRRRTGEIIGAIPMLAALVIIPAMATTGAILSESGPGLMFISLPYLFKSMPGGQIVMVVFFVAVLFAGLTSLVNLFEAPIAALQDHMKFSRLKAVAIVGIIGVVVSVCIQGIVSPWMDFVSIYVCPLGAALAGIMFAWVWGKQAVEDAVSVGRKARIGGWYYPLYKYLFCVLTAVVFILGAVNGGIG